MSHVITFSAAVLGEHAKLLQKVVQVRAGPDQEMGAEHPPFPLRPYQLVVSTLGVCRGEEVEPKLWVVVGRDVRQDTRDFKVSFDPL